MAKFIDFCNHRINIDHISIYRKGWNHSIEITTNNKGLGSFRELFKNDESRDKRFQELKELMEKN